MKTIFIIAGFDLHSDASSPKFKTLRNKLSAKGCRVVPVPISWFRTRPRQYSAKFIDFYKANKGDYNVVIGNSFGAVVALFSAVELQPNELYLCSISPFFKGDVHDKPDTYFEKIFGKNRMAELRSTNFDILANEINQLNIKTTVTYGQKEHLTSPPLVRRCKEAAKKISNSRLIELPTAPHSLSDPKYTKELLKLL